jgi:hypothetical protein
MTFLVANAALHWRVDPEDVADGLAQRLGAVDDHQDALLDIQAALDEVREQGGRDGRVLGRAVPQPERVLDAVGVDPQGDDAAAALQLDPVEHHDRQAQIIQRARHEIDQVRARARHELAADRRLRRRPGDLVDVGPDRLAGARVPARRHAGEHPLEHDVRQPVARREVRVRVQLDLVLSASGAGTRPADRDAAAAERDLAAIAAVTHRGPLRIVLALRAHDLIELRLHQLMQHAQPDPDAQREQPLLRGAGELAERLLHRARQLLDALLAGHDRGSRYGPHGGWSSCPRWTCSHSPRSQPDRTRREDRRLKFYELRDNLGCGAAAPCASAGSPDPGRRRSP